MAESTVTPAAPIPAQRAIKPQQQVRPNTGNRAPFLPDHPHRADHDLRPDDSK
jgi:hypothetical protein